MYNPPEIIRHDHLPTVLVAGGAGFLGLSLCESLLSQNFRVVAVDNFETGKRDGLSGILSHPRFVLFEHDLNRGLPEKIKSVDFIFHLAAHEIYLANKDTKVTLDSLLTNALATHHLLEFTRTSAARFLFASTLDVYQGALSATDLWHYFGPSENEEKIFSHSEAKRFAESLVWEYFKKYDLDVRIVRLGELYGPKMDLSSAGQLGRLIRELINGRDLTVEGEGLEKSYYGYLADVVAGLNLAMFKDKTKGKIFPLADLSPVTTLEQAYLLKKLANRPTEVVFKPSTRQFRLPEAAVGDSRGQKELDWAPQVSLKQGLISTLRSLNYNLPKDLAAAPGISSPPPLPPAAKKKPAKISLPANLSLKPPFKKPSFSLFRPGFLGALILVLFLLPPLLRLSYYSWQAMRSLGSLQKQAGRLEIAASQKAAEDAAQNLSQIKTAAGSTFIPYRESLAPLLSAALYTAKGLSALIPTLTPFKEAVGRLGFTSFRSEPSAAGILTTAEMENKLGEAGENFSYALAEMKNIKKEAVPALLQGKAEQLNQALLSLMRTTELLKILQADLSYLSGQPGRRIYLALFQNSNELRPGGGFIGSYARFSLDNGYLKDLKIDDIYNPDGLLDEKKIVYAVPLPLKENLGVAALRLRDANWPASFPESGRIVADLYQKATGEAVDGVIAFDLSVAAKLLRVLGPITLPTYNETIDSENLFEKAQFHAEAGFFPGSTGKKTFLSLLSAQLLSNLFELKADKLPSLFAALENSLLEKNLQIYLPESQLSPYLKQQGWDGAVKEDAEGDFLMPVEANVGSTKSNYFIRRQVKYVIDKISRGGEMEANLTLNYLHTGKDNNWPGGPYKAYLRILTPKRSALLKAVRSTSDLEGKGEDITEKVKVGSEAGKTTFETSFTIKAGESLALRFSYVLPPEILKLPSAKNYRLFFQKQPGAGEDPLTMEFAPPFGKNLPEDIGASGWEKIGGRARWQGTLDRDLSLTLPLE